MKANKYISILAIAGVLLLSAPCANAMPIFDVTRGVGKVFVTVSDFAKTVQEKITDLQNQIKGLKWLQTGINAVKSIKATYDANVEMAKKYQKLYKETMETDAVVIAKLNIEIKALESSIAELEAKKETISAQYYASLSTQKSLINSKMASLEESNEFYKDKTDEDSLAIVEANNNMIIALGEELLSLEISTQSAIDTDVKALDKEIKSLEKEKAKKEDEVSSMLNSIVTDFLDDTKALLMSQDLNFVSANKALTTLEIAEIKKNRAAERDTATVEAFTKSIGLKSMLSGKIGDRTVLSNQSDGLEEFSANILMLTESKMDDVEDLLVYAELMLLDLKLQTAQELASSTEYSMENSDKNQEKFDLGDYEFDYQAYKDAKLKKESLSIKSFMKNVEDVKEIGQDLKEEFVEGGAVDEWSDFAEDSVENDGKSYKVDDVFEDAKDGINSLEKEMENTVEAAMGL
ncbi:MAG: hypothetical protein R3Y43_06220 [Alphaproteobacteria bacterium]